MNKLEIKFALNLVDKIERNVVGYNKVRAYCEGLRDIFEEQREKNLRKHKNIRKAMSKEQIEKLIKSLHKGRNKRSKERKK